MSDMPNIEQKKVSEWLDHKWKNEKSCEICKEKSWHVSKDLVTPVLFQNGSLGLGGNSYPQIMLICKNCGNTKYFNTVIMGITVPPPKGAENAG